MTCAASFGNRYPFCNGLKGHLAAAAYGNKGRQGYAAVSLKVLKINLHGWGHDSEEGNCVCDK